MEVMMQTKLPTRTLGRTGLEVTQLGFGAMELRGPARGPLGGREASEERVECVLNGVLEAGINFIDTSPDYGWSEDRIGKYISDRREAFYLATKCGCNVSPDGVDRSDPSHVWTPDQLKRNIDLSLERMKTDHVDVLQMHNPPAEDVRTNRLVTALQRIRDEGKVRFIGVSSTSTASHPTPSSLAAFVEMGVFDAFQIPYSALERGEERMIQRADDTGAGIIIRGGVAQGHTDLRGHWYKWDDAGLDELLDGMNRYEFMLRFTLTHPACHTAITGTVNPDHLAANVAAAKAGPLPAGVYEEATRRLAAVGEVPRG
jgi:aryl-alcohol dehydrogenase-like predicted oxidoreductase